MRLLQLGALFKGVPLFKKVRRDINSNMLLFLATLPLQYVDYPISTSYNHNA